MLEEQTQERGARGGGEPASGETGSGESGKKWGERKTASEPLGGLGCGAGRCNGEGSRSQPGGEGRGTPRGKTDRGGGGESGWDECRGRRCIFQERNRENYVSLAFADAPFPPRGGLSV